MFEQMKAGGERSCASECWLSLEGRLYRIILLAVCGRHGERECRKMGEEEKTRARSNGGKGRLDGRRRRWMEKCPVLMILYTTFLGDPAVMQMLFVFKH